MSRNRETHGPSTSDSAVGAHPRKPYRPGAARGSRSRSMPSDSCSSSAPLASSNPPHRYFLASSSACGSRERGEAGGFCRACRRGEESELPEFEAGPARRRPNRASPALPLLHPHRSTLGRGGVACTSWPAMAKQTRIGQRGCGRPGSTRRTSWSRRVWTSGRGCLVLLTSGRGGSKTGEPRSVEEQRKRRAADCLHRKMLDRSEAGRGGRPDR
ncbi:hypothetical protein BJY59DRAFT_488008 [Rhodotorula toruloides]